MATKKSTKKSVKSSKKATAKGSPKKVGPSPSQIKILIALRSGKELTRKELAKLTGIKKGWSRLLGASTKEGSGVGGANSLEGMGMIKAAKYEGSRSLLYSITVAGKGVLGKAPK